MDRALIDLKDTKAMLARALKEAFPDVKFSVRMRRGRTNSLDISWTDGPNVEQVEAVADVYAGSYFDGMSDLQGSRYFLLDGQAVRLDSDYVNVERIYSDAAVSRAIDRVFSKHAAVLAEFGAERPEVAEYRRGALMSRSVPPSLRERFYDMQALIRDAMVRHTDRVKAQPSPTRERIVFVSEDGHRADDSAIKARAAAAREAAAAPMPAAVSNVFQLQAPERLQ